MKLNSTDRPIFFTSDTHFGHKAMAYKWRKNGVPFCAPWFHDSDSMDEHLIWEWNRTVPEDGIVFHMGDVSFRNSKDTAAILQRLNGVIHLVRGNHDKQIIGMIGRRFASVQDLLDIRITTAEGEHVFVVMCHYAFRVWNRAHHGAWNLHGHSHGNLPPQDNKQLDVGVDCNIITNELRPVSFEEIRVYMQQAVWHAVDHHV